MRHKRRNNLLALCLVMVTMFAGTLNVQAEEETTTPGITLTGVQNGVYQSAEGANCWQVEISENTTGQEVLFFDVYAGNTKITKEKIGCKKGTLGINLNDSEHYTSTEFDANQVYIVKVYTFNNRKPNDDPKYVATARLYQVGYQVGDEFLPYINGTVTKGDSASVSGWDTAVVGSNGTNYTTDSSAINVEFQGSTTYGIPCTEDSVTAPTNTVAGTITYVDSNGTYLGKKTGIDLTDGYTEDVSTYTDASGLIYQLADGQEKTISLTTASPDATVIYNAIESDASKETKVVKIQYVDENGAEILSDTITVKTAVGYTYFAPTSFTKASSNENAVMQYSTTSDKAKVVIAKNSEETTYSVPYTTTDNRGTRTWNIYMIDAYTGTQLASPEVLQVEKDGSASFIPEKSITYNGATYTLDSQSAGTVTKNYDDALGAVYVYYNPEGYAASQGYPITVQFVNVADSSIIYTTQMTTTPEADTVIDCPENYATDDAQYVLLNGQATSIRHSYYSPKRTYTIYYRNVNDTIYSEATVTTIDVVTNTTEENTEYNDIPGNVTVITNPGTNETLLRNEDGTTATAVGTTTATTDGTTTIGNADANGDGTISNVEAVDAGAATTTAQGTAQDPETVTAIDGQTPLANVDASTDSASSTSSILRWIALGAAVLVIAGLAIFIIMNEKKKKSEGGNK